MVDNSSTYEPVADACDTVVCVCECVCECVFVTETESERACKAHAKGGRVSECVCVCEREIIVKYRST